MRSEGMAQTARPRRVLLVAASGLGDLVGGVGPLVARLAQARPAVSVDLLTTQPEAAAFFGRRVRRVIPLDRAWMSGAGRMLAALWRAAGDLREAGPYDAAVVTFPSGHWATSILAWLSGAPRRVGYAYPEGAARRARRGLTVVAECAASHMAERNLALAALAAPEATFDAPADPSAGQPERPPADGRAVAFHAGGSAAEPFKRWPVESFAVLGRLFAARGYRVFLLGGEADRAAARRLAEALGSAAVDCTRGLRLAETAGILARCRLLVANDTGLAHLAAALGVPVVAVFGPTDERRFAPRGAAPADGRETPVRVVSRPLACRPCYTAPTPRRFFCSHERPRACLEDLPPEDVFAAARDLLAADPREVSR